MSAAPIPHLQSNTLDAARPTQPRSVLPPARVSVLAALKTGLELADSAMRGIYPGVEAITGVPLKLIDYYEVSYILDLVLFFLVSLTVVNAPL